MTTSCVIAKKTPNGFKATHKFWDGYPEYPGVGWQLREEYRTPAQVDILLSEEKPFNKSRAEYLPDTDSLLAYTKETGSQYLYLYDKGKWRYWDIYQNDGWNELL